MTLQQLKYAVVTAEKGTVSKAAASLYIAQPSLTKALKELEKEMGISIFNRTNKGVFVSKEGEVFLGYARQVLEQAALITEKYTHQSGGKQEFCVSTQHYSFAVNAFVDLIQVYGSDNYEQGEHNSFYYSEEIFSTEIRSKNIRVRDRATLFNLLIGLNGYTICSGVIDEELNGENIVAIPLAENGSMHIGYITKKHAVPSRLGSIYLDALKRYAKNS